MNSPRESESNLYYERRIGELNEDLIEVSAVASRLRMLEDAFFEMSQASDRDSIYATTARTLINLTGARRALVTRADGTVQELGEGDSLRAPAFRTSAVIPNRVTSGLTEDLNAPLYVGEGGYVWAPIVSIGGVHGHVYIDGIDTMADGATMVVESLVRFAGASLETLLSAQAITESNFFKDDLLFMFTHDFRTPLGVILGYADMLKEDTAPTAASTQGSASRIIDAAERLERMAEDALSLVKSQSAGFSLSRESFDLVELVREIIRSQDVSGTRVEYDVLDPSVIVYADANRLRHVFDNLISNALKYSKEQVSIRISERDSIARVTVQDRGIGIPPDEIQGLFNRLSRASNAKAYKGHGVGLYIANKIVEAHGGRIAVSSLLDRGSVFELNLPTR